MNFYFLKREGIIHINPNNNYLMSNWLKITSIVLSVAISISLFPMESRAALESLYEEISRYHNMIVDLKEEEKTLENEISILENEIKEIELRIEATQQNIDKIMEEIKVLAFDISIKEKKIEELRGALMDYYRILNELDRISPIEIIFSSNSFSEFFDEFKSIATLQNRVQDTQEEYFNLKTELESKREEQVSMKSEEEALRRMQEDQRKSVDDKRLAKETILDETKGSEDEYQKLITESSDYWMDIMKDEFQLIDTDELIYIKDAYDHAAFAAEKTGVRKALILAVITQETYFGLNTGTGYYKDNMHPDLWSDFEQICYSLDINPNDRNVSAKPENYPGWGGAMGPAQIMPSMWLRWKDDISELIEKDNPSPWDPKDAFMGSAVILRELGATNHSLESERQAAGRYFAGGNWKDFPWYADQVMEKVAWFD